jgi:hypothetical protein
MSPRSASTDETSRFSPSFNDGSTTEGAHATCPRFSAIVEDLVNGVRAAFPDVHSGQHQHT